MTTEQKNIPPLRFPEFSEKWNLDVLGNTLTEIKGGGTPSRDKKEYYENGTIPWVTVKDLSDDNYKNNTVEYITELGLNECSAKLIPENTFIISTRMGLGRGFINQIPMAINQDMKALFPETNMLDTVFLMLWYKKNATLIEKLGVGSTVKGIDLGTLRKLPIGLPKIPEQQKIAEFLTAVDARIQQLIKKKNLLEQYKKGVMQQIFSQQVRFKDEQGNDYPEWEIKSLKSVANKVKEKNKNNSLSFVLTNSATQGIVSQMEYFDNSVANENNLTGYYIVKKDDFVYNPRISSTAPVGPIKRNSLNEGLMSPLYSVFRFHDNNLDYLEYYFETDLWHDHLKSVANYGARHDRMSITNDNFMEMPISLPCIREQETIAFFISSIDAKINSVQTEIEQTQKFKKGLLQQMFV